MGVYDQMGRVTAATRSRAEEIVSVAVKEGFKLTRIYGIGTKGNEHPTGRALDFMITGPGLGRSAGDFIADYLWANRTRLNLKWIIWNGRIRSTTPGKPSTWTKYYGSNPHTDHVHAFFGTASYKAPTPPSGGGSAQRAEWWHVNPDKVSSFLWGLKGGKRQNIRARPNRNIAIVKFVKDKRRTWAVTAADNWFAKEYLIKGKAKS